jgi:hypothetical protein
MVLEVGQSCDYIAQHLFISRDAFVAMNPGLDCNALVVGSTVCVTAGCTSFWPVVGGDTCDSIAIAFQLTLAKLLAMNPYFNCNEIGSRPRICINGPETCTFRWTVSGGDTCDSIRNGYQLSPDALFAMNPGLDCNALPIGSTVCLSGPARPPPPPGQPPPLIIGCITFFTIQVGDSCDSIAGVQLNRAEFISINPEVDCNALILGSKVCKAAPIPCGGSPCPFP